MDLMEFSGLQLLLLMLLLTSLGSFTWAMRSFFIRPAGMTPGMKLVNLYGALCAVLHVLAILTTKTLTTTAVLCGAALYAASLGLFWWAIRANSRSRLSAIF